MDMTTAKKLWIHCNVCFEHYVDKKSIIFLLACQHVICEKCITANLGRTPNEAPTYTCPMCKKQVRGRQVNNALPTNLKHMFHPEPWSDGLPHLLITTFQKANLKNLLDHTHRKEKETEKYDKDMELAEKICRKHYMEQHRLRMERKQLELHVKKVHRQAQIRKQEAAQRLVRKRRTTNTNFVVDENRQVNKRSVSTPAQPPKAAITSFLHSNNNHSFLL